MGLYRICTLLESPVFYIKISNINLKFITRVLKFISFTHKFINIMDFCLEVIFFNQILWISLLPSRIFFIREKNIVNQIERNTSSWQVTNCHDYKFLYQNQRRLNDSKCISYTLKKSVVRCSISHSINYKRNLKMKIYIYTKQPWFTSDYSVLLEHRASNNFSWYTPWNWTV